MLNRRKGTLLKVRHTNQAGITRIGIYSGAFDPVHAGHVAFALQAAKAAELGQVCMMPERIPRHKPHVTHYAHRVAMLRRAIRPHQVLSVLESEDRSFSTTHTLPRLQRQFSGATLVFLCGSDVLQHMASWPHVTQFLENVELCVGIRKGETTAAVEQALRQLPVSPQAVFIVDSYVADASSSEIRQAIRQQLPAHGLLQSVVAYAKRAWLYL